jgi:Protein of unknown function (DUF3800)
MALMVYLDECGDHSMELIDKKSPVFALVMLICNQADYIDRIVPAVCRLKFDYIGHEAVVLHSRDIRKRQGRFSFLKDPAINDAFMQRLASVMAEQPYTLIAAAIRKQVHKDKYGVRANHPYHLALEFCMERLLYYLEGTGETEVQIVVESRGKVEDRLLQEVFMRTIEAGTYYIPAERFHKYLFRFELTDKVLNTVGTQLADLAAHPIAQFAGGKQNRAFDIIKCKFYRGRGRAYGLKIFP